MPSNDRCITPTRGVAVRTMTSNTKAAGSDVLEANDRRVAAAKKVVDFTKRNLKDARQANEQVMAELKDAEECRDKALKKWDDDEKGVNDDQEIVSLTRELIEEIIAVLMNQGVLRCSS